MERGTGFVRRSAVESAVRTVVIIFLDPQGDRLPGVVEALVLVDPDLLFLQAAVEAFDIAVSLGVVVRGAAVRRCDGARCRAG